MPHSLGRGAKLCPPCLGARLASGAHTLPKIQKSSASAAPGALQAIPEPCALPRCDTGSPTLAAMPPKGVDQPAREAMTTKIAQRLTTMLAGQNMIEAARQIEAKCYDSAKDATDYKRKVEKRLAKAAKALEASQRPSMSEPSDTAPLEKKQALARKRSREDAAPEWLDLLRAARDSDSARDLLREHGATLEWWRGAPAVIGRRLRAIIDAATQAGSVGDEARTWASGALQKVEKLEKAATSLLKPLEARSGNLAELPGYCTKLKESKAELESKLDKLAPLLGWRDVPAPVQLVVCGYLDLKALGRLEICGRNLDAVRAWNTKVAGLARGTLGDLSTKQFLRAVHSCSNTPGGP